MNCSGCNRKLPAYAKYGYCSTNIECARIGKKLWARTHTQRAKEYNKAYSQRPEVKARRVLCGPKEKAANNFYRYIEKYPHAKAAHRVRVRVRNFLIKKHKYSKSLGCSLEQFKIHIEAQFQPGMSWDNYGQWHIDHKHPLSKAYTEGPESFAKACHYSNLQPLWAKDNISKGNRCL